MISYVTFVFGIAVFCYAIGWIFKSKTAGILGTVAMVLATAGNTAGFILRWVETYQVGYGHIPLSNLYESLVFFSMAMGIVYLFVEYRYKIRVIGMFAALAAFLSLAYASLPSVGSQIQPLMPALQSNWLIVHVISYFFGYASLTLAFCVSLLFLFKSGSQSPDSGIWEHIPSLKNLDELTYQLVIFGFLLITLGLITGAVWAEQAWGRYWGWDPKETWSLITWFIYATLLHARLMRGWEGKRLAYISILGFAAVLFTYFGVNLLPGLHSYL
ncbi:MAG: c-type cytochrome biogenesis protein CcsB [Desulfosalsimonadaceae bacterium]